MGRVLLVHGINNTFRGPAQMTQQWLPSLIDGVRLAGGDVPLSVDDVSCVFFGDIFRPGGVFLGDDGVPDLDGDNVADGLEFDLLMAWWEAAARVDAAVAAPNGPAMLGVRSGARAALLALSGARFLARASEAVLVWWLKQVTSYFTDEAVREAVRARFTAALTADTRVVVAHSLGSVVAYEGLCGLAAPAATDLVSLGSPLGVRHVVFDRLRPAPTRGPGGSLQGVWPGVRRWVNIVDRADFVAIQPRLRVLFGDRVVDVGIDNGVRAHMVKRYLSAAETGAAVLSGLRSDPAG